MAGASGSLSMADLPDTALGADESKTRILGVRGRDLKDDILLMVKQENDLPMFVNLGKYSEVVQNQNEQEILEALEEIQKEDKATVSGYVSNYDIAEMIGKKQTAVKMAMSRLLRRDGGNMWKNYRVETKRGKDGGMRLIPR
jgi:hypothetical protein